MKLKNLLLIKCLSIFLITVILTQSVQAANNGIFLSEESAKLLIVDLEYQKKTLTNQEQQITILKDENINLFRISEQYQLKIDGLTKDKEIHKVRAEKFEKGFTETSKALTDCKNDTPSKLSWFGIGFVTAIILGTAAAFAIAK